MPEDILSAKKRRGPTHLIVDGLDTRHHPLYSIWAGIVKRCCSPNNSAYKNYGARGIKMCDRWRYSFAAFVADMGPRPTLKHSVGRIENNGDYSPDNCRWETSREQTRNARYNRFLIAGGKTQTVVAWSEETGIAESTIYNRLLREANAAQALGLEPLVKKKTRWSGTRTTPLPTGWTNIAKAAGLKHQTVLRRVQVHGWTFDRAISTPVQESPFRACRVNEVADCKLEREGCMEE